MFRLLFNFHKSVQIKIIGETFKNEKVFKSQNSFEIFEIIPKRYKKWRRGQNTVAKRKVVRNLSFTFFS